MGFHRRVSAVVLFVAPLAAMAADAPDPTPRTPLGKITADSLAKDYASERAHLPANKTPRIGLALSGGGTKAAMFAHGVLHGLHDANVLEKVDVISSVSGGSYAAFWYMSKYLESTRSPNFHVSQIFDDCLPSYWTQHDTDKDILAAMEAAKAKPPKAGMPECENAAHFRAKGSTGADDPFRWQAHLVRWPDVLQVQPVRLDGGRQGRPEREIRTGVVRDVTIGVIRHVLAGAKSDVPLLYQYGIERTWGLNPKPRDAALVADNARHDESLNWQYTNLRLSEARTKRIPRANPDLLQWEQLRAVYSSPLVAMPPLWIANANDGMKVVGVNTERIFEMTPFGFGTANPMHAGYFNRTPARMAIADLGTSTRASAAFADPQGVANPFWQRALSLFSHLVAGVEWGVDVDLPTPRGAVQVHLSDGGGGDDLGLYTLLKRGLDDIIVVDTASDPEGDMADLCDVRRALKEKDNVDLDFPALLKLGDVCKGGAYNISAWKNPVVKGTATWRDADGKPARSTRIWLIKAAWDERAVAAAYTHPQTCGNGPGKINCLLAVFYGHNREVHDKKDNYMLFPQLSTVTTTANSSSYLFWGYRELGRMLAAYLHVTDDGRVELRDDRQCKQAALPRVKHHRPETMKFKGPTPCDPVEGAPPG